MSLLKKPGAPLFIVGVIMFVLVTRIAGAVPLVGGLLSPIAWVLGLFGMIGGGYLILRSILGPGASS